jgi:phosphoserine phosphatase
MSTPILKARSDLGVAVRLGDRNKALRARRDLAAAKLEDYVARVVSEAPPLTPEQRDRIATLLRSAA